MYPLGEQDPVRGLAADVAEGELRRPEGEEVSQVQGDADLLRD